MLAAVDNCRGSAAEIVHTLHKGQEQGAPGQHSKVNPVTPMSHLYNVGARVEGTERYRLREVVLRILIILIISLFLCCKMFVAP